MVFIPANKKLGPDAVPFTNYLDFQHGFSKFTCIRKSAKNKRKSARYYLNSQMGLISTEYPE